MSQSLQTKARSDVPNYLKTHTSTTTVTTGALKCHISKDGHYFIQPNPDERPILTVREAARLLTIPNHYMLLGNRTQQCIVVGNIVPPYLARQVRFSLTRPEKANCRGYKARGS
ncbi:MAG: DNA cytosine methyltransferase [Pararhodobacter sp.]|nr:DNA cytosine methyltransferase [Pararhodobacter sp.]